MQESEESFSDLLDKGVIFYEGDGKFVTLENLIQSQTEKHVPDPDIWSKLRQCVADIKIRKYKTPLLPPLTHEEITNIEQLLPTSYGIPKDLYLYLSLVSREIMVTKEHEIHNIGTDIEEKLLKIEDPMIYPEGEDPLTKLNLKGICIGGVNRVDGYGSVIICLNKGQYYGTVWIIFWEVTAYGGLCLEQLINEEFFHKKE